MKPYNLHSPCPKCETVLDASASYHCTIEDDGTTIEVMIRTCNCCGYQWDEAPLDISCAEPDIKADDALYQKTIDALIHAREYVKLVSKKTLGRGINYDFADYDLLDEIESVIEKAEYGGE